MRRTVRSIIAAVAAVLSLCMASLLNAASIWQVATGASSWATAANWNPSGNPSAVGAAVTFNGAATGNNPAQTGNRTANLDAAQTVGSIVFNTDLSTFTNTIAPNGGSLTFDETGSGPATITTQGVGTGNNTISAAMTLTDSVVANVNNTAASSAAGSLNLTGTMGGAGGFTKNGDGLATFGTGAKTYTGATVLNGGRLRSSTAAQPSATSSFTINSGGQLTLISAGTYTFGSGPLNLNGTGPTTGPFAGFPGAIRPDTSLVLTIANSVVLQSNSVLHSQGAGTGSITLSGAVSGPGKLIAGSTPHDANIGQIILSGTAGNTYSGGSEVVAGGLVAAAASVNAFGTGDVTVDSGNATFAGSSAKLSILAGALNSIADTATLFLAGGGVGGTADDGYADLGAGINEFVSGLWLGGVQQGVLGTYGSTASGATFQNNEYFAGTGVVTLVPEPSSLLLICAGAFGLAVRRRR